MPRYFTLAQAERALPKVEERIREALFVKAEHQRAEEELRGITRKILLSGGVIVDQTHVAGVKSAKERAAARLQEACEEIQEIGCFVKDLDIGLLDFPTLYKGREVYLCWRLGEDRIRFWHHVEDGFRGRQPIDDEFLDNHEGGGENDGDS
jgi:hypothetical protein